MFDAHISADDFKNICIGLAALLGAYASLVWAYRRDPKSSESGQRRLPPAE